MMSSIAKKQDLIVFCRNIGATNPQQLIEHVRNVIQKSEFSKAHSTFIARFLPSFLQDTSSNNTNIMLLEKARGDLEAPRTIVLDDVESKIMWDCLMADSQNQQEDDHTNAEKATSRYVFRPHVFFRHLRPDNAYASPLILGREVSSTQTLLKEQFNELKEGTVFVADTQSQGKGRGNNQWTSLEGCLMFSFKTYHRDGTKLPFLQYLVSLALVKAIRNNYSDKLNVKIKWPNDIYAVLDDGDDQKQQQQRQLKIGGIICHSSYLPDVAKFDITTGVGINVWNEEPTTCLNALLRRVVNENTAGSNTTTTMKPIITKESLLANFLNEFESMYATFDKHGFDPFLSDYYDNWLHTNQKVVLQQQPEQQGSPKTVWIQGLSPSGFLVGEDAEGQRFELHPDGNSFDFFRGMLYKKVSVC